MLSVDIAIEAELGDLTKTSTIDTWADHILSRRVWNTGGGPPCETWSAARWLEGGPPPLRTHEWFWGIPGVTDRQALQLDIGNILLQNLVFLLGCHMVAGTSGWGEHPLPPYWRPQAPSSFYWEPIEALRSSPVCVTADFDQCVHHPSDTAPASIGRAPTRLIGLRMPCLAQRLTDTARKGWCHHPKGSHRSLQGKEKRDGKTVFRTNAKKTYPALMCSHLAASIAASIARIHTDIGSEADVISPDDPDLVKDLWTFYVKGVDAEFCPCARLRPSITPPVQTVTCRPRATSVLSHGGGRRGRGTCECVRL